MSVSGTHHCSDQHAHDTEFEEMVAEFRNNDMGSPRPKWAWLTR